MNSETKLNKAIHIGEWKPKDAGKKPAVRTSGPKMKQKDAKVENECDKTEQVEAFFLEMKASIPIAPSFYPTSEEFSKPIEYFQKIKDQAECYGFARIVTPEGWRPSEVPKTTEPFDSYRQAIHVLKTGRQFDTGDYYTEQTYRSYANALKEKWIQNCPQLQSEGSEDENNEISKEYLSEVIEKSYWELVDDHKGRMTVDYASNHSIQSNAMSSSWSFHSLFNEEGNVLKDVNVEIPGITVPWLYYGCLFATFCWHVEDHYLYSLNYMHTGDSKIWYGIPAAKAEVFEEYLTSFVSTRSMKSDVLHQLTMMVSPFSFPESIPVYKLVQNPGDIILTFPRAFHGGYSEGWNCAEAVNFGTMDWLYLGQLAAKRCRSIRHYKNSVFSHDRLLWILFHKAKEANERSNALPESLKQAIIDAIHFEMETRTMLRSRLFNVREVVPARRWELDWESWTCESCHTHLFFSYVSCQCRGEKGEVLCAMDALERQAFPCGCVPYLCLERTDEELNKLIQSVLYATSEEEENIIENVEPSNATNEELNEEVNNEPSSVS